LKKLSLPFVTPFIMLAFLLVPALAVQYVDVSAKFVAYAQSYCGSNNVNNADIGNGNLVNSYKASRRLIVDNFESAKLGAQMRQKTKEELMDLGIMPGRAAGWQNDSSLELGDCNEQWGNTCVNSAGLYHWCNYSQYKCMAKYSGQSGAVTFYNMVSAPSTPEPYNFFVQNGLDKEVTADWSQTISVTNTQTMSSSTAYHIGDTLTISASAPSIMSGSLSFDWSMDMNSASSTTKTTTQTYNLAQPIPEQPLAATMVLVTLSKQKFSGAWKADILLPYYAKLWCNNEVNGHHEWFVPASYFMGSGPYEGTGTFTGAAGMTTEITLSTCAYGTTSAADC